jgi:hypothetical protein
MLKKIFLLGLIICFYLNCQESSDKNNCVLIISHQECTDCLDVHVDSGEVKIPKHIQALFKGIKLKSGRVKNEPNLADLNLNDATLFKHLWGGYFKVNSENDTLNYDFFNRYRVKGYVLGFDSTGHTLFRISEYAVLDSLTNKKIE